jgi:hypothetical protein
VRDRPAIAARAGSLPAKSARTVSMSTGNGWRVSPLAPWTRKVGSVKTSLRAFRTRKIERTPSIRVARGYRQEVLAGGLPQALVPMSVHPIMLRCGEVWDAHRTERAICIEQDSS